MDKTTSTILQALYPLQMNRLIANNVSAWFEVVTMPFRVFTDLAKSNFEIMVGKK